MSNPNNPGGGGFSGSIPLPFIPNRTQGTVTETGVSISTSSLTNVQTGIAANANSVKYVMVWASAMVANSIAGDGVGIGIFQTYTGVGNNGDPLPGDARNSGLVGWTSVTAGAKGCVSIIIPDTVDPVAPTCIYSIFWRAITGGTASISSGDQTSLAVLRLQTLDFFTPKS